MTGATAGTAYPVRTIVEIARIPEDAMPRFLAEFPMIVDAIRAHIQMVEAITESPANDGDVFDSVKNLTWIDDDAGNVNVTISTEDDVRLLDLHANYKTGEFRGSLARDAHA